jgi:MipA family protein
LSPQAALATALSLYRPDGGLHSAAATSGLSYSINGRWGLFGFARYERLVGESKSSPIVKFFGSPNQYSAGLGLTYAFGIRKEGP